MKNSTLNNFSFKKVLLVCLFVALSISLSGLFALNNTNKIETVSAQAIEQEIFAADGEIKQYQITTAGAAPDSVLDYDVSPAATNSAKHYDYTYDGGLVGATIYAGTTIAVTSFTEGQIDIVVTLANSSGTLTSTKKNVKFTAHNGYKFTKVKVKNTEFTGTGSKTTEQVDDKYSGEILITAETTKIKYKIQAYYEQKGTIVSSPFEIEYDIESTFKLADYKPPESDEQFAYWLGIANTKYNSKNENEDFIVWGNTTINCGTEKIVTPYGDGYELTTIQEGSYGNLTQVRSEPTIIAVFKRKYEAVVQNSYKNSYWNNITGTGLNETKKSELCNAGEKKESQIIKITAGTGAKGKLMSTNNAFKAAAMVECVEGKYSVFNYGHSITKWKIEVKYKTTASTTEYTDSTLTEKSTDTELSVIADDIDKRLATCVITSITFTPEWEAVHINVKYDGKSKKLDYGTLYTLDTCSFSGQTHFAFKYGNTVIAKNAAWNYIEGLNYTGSNSDYEISIDPYGLNNVYKVLLEDVVPYTKGTYFLDDDTEYKFATKFGAGKYASKAAGDVNSYTYFKGSMPLYTTNTIVSDYITKLKQYEDSYNTITLGEHDFFKRVYYEAGDQLDDLSIYGNTGALWVYIAHDTKKENLPSFKSSFKGAVAWKMDNGNYLKSTEWKSEYQDETGKDCVSKWTYYASATSQTLTAFNMNKVHLYYNISDTVYAKHEAKYYGKEYTLDFSAIGEGTEWNAQKKFFGGWMLDTKAAKDNGYEVRSVTDGVELEKDGTTWTFNVTGSVNNSVVSGEKFYYITSIIKDTDTTPDSIDFVQSGLNPVIKMRWSNIFDLTIKNDKTYWTDVAGGEVENPSNLYGAVSSGNNVTDFITTFELKDTGDYDYVFMSSVDGTTSKGLSFFHKDDFKPGEEDSYVITATSGGWYYVYNYGHYITGWYVEVDFKDKDKATKYINASMIFSKSKSPIGIDDAQYINFTEIAKAIDDYMVANGYVATPTITIQPSWEASKLKVQDNSGHLLSSNITNITFGSFYGLNISSVAETGKSVFALKAGDSYISAINNASDHAGHWNYTKIGQEHFTDYDSSDSGNTDPNDVKCIGSGVYTLKVIPVFVDNIYKIELSNAVNVSGNDYQIEDKDFAFTQDETKYLTMLNFLSNTNKKANDIVADVTFDDKYFFKYYKEDDGVSSGTTAETSLMEDYYILDLIDLEDDYNNGINGDSANRFTIFDKLLTKQGTISSKTSLTNASGTTLYIYLANNKKIYDLPRFKNDLSSLVYWKDNLDNAYTTLNYDEAYKTELTTGRSLTPKTGDSSKWIQTDDGNQIITAGYMYSIRLYYKYYEDKDKAYSSINTGYLGDNLSLNKAGFFGGYHYVQDLTTNYDYIPDTTKKQIFYKWIFNKKVLKDNYPQYVFNRTGDENSGTLTITSSSGDEWTFAYNGVNEYAKDTMFYITSVKGGTRFVQDAEHPIIYAKWKNIYDLGINNTTTSWKDLGPDNPEKLYGAYSLDEEENITNKDGNAFTTTIKLVDEASVYNYPFMNSEKVLSSGDLIGLSYYHLADWQDADEEMYAQSALGHYYVFNYGYYISGWKIAVSYDNVNYYVNESFAVNNGSPVEIAIGSLNDDYLYEVARAVDEKFAGGDYQAIITLYPCWSATNIKVRVNNEDNSNEDDSLHNSLDLTFNRNIMYSLNSILDNYSIAGKSVMSCYYGNDPSLYLEKLIATSGRWNYQNIDKDEFASYTKVAGHTYGQGVYKLIVKPHYVNDIYKITLTNAKTFSIDEDTKKFVFKLSNTDFQFYNSNTDYKFNGGQYGFSNNIDSDYEFKYFEISGLNLVDLYLENLRDYIKDYETGVATGSLDILRKVYYSTGKTNNVEVEDGKNAILNVYNLNIANLEAGITFHMYLANEEKTGNLPVFEKEYYDLIFWENKNPIAPDVLKYYLYPTDLYNPDAEGHPEEIDGFAAHKTSDVFDYTWSVLDDSNNGIDVTFVAHYFRKNYEVQISTVFKETGAVERRGYAVLQITDIIFKPDEINDNVDATYLVIYDYAKGGMVVYKYNGLLKDTITGVPIDRLILYAGCDITLYAFDQSKDPQSMDEGDFDDIIGYKFSKTINQKLDGTLLETDKRVFTEDSLNVNPTFKHSTLSQEIGMEDYAYTAEAKHIEDLGFINKQKIQIELEFEKILYSMDIKIDEGYAGHLNLKINGVSIGQGDFTSCALSGIKVYDTYNLNYYAYAGYKLQNDAFVIYVEPNKNMNKVILQRYNEASVTDENLQQNYLITKNFYGANQFDGTWLREVFYQYNTGYEVDLINIGQMMIYTEVIEFNFGLKLYDSTQVGNEFFETRDCGEILKLNKSTGRTLTNKISNYLDVDKYGFYVYISEDGVDYALLNSRLYFPHDSLTQDGKQYTTYSFLLVNEPTNKFDIVSSILESMVINFENGVIISPKDNNRDIFLMLEVRKLLKIDLKVAKMKHDTNETVRKTTVSNADNNSVTLMLSRNEDADSVSPFDTSPIVGTYSKTAVVYSYNGLENKVMSEFNAAHYQRVEYILNEGTTPLRTNSFIIDEDSTLVVKFMPLSINTTEFKYTLDGDDITQDEALEYIKEIVKPNLSSEYYVGDSFTYTVECTDNDYNVAVSVNGESKGRTSAGDSYRTLTVEHKVQASDFNDGKFLIVVNIIPQDGSSISIRYQLTDSTKKCADDDYGTMTVFEDDVIKEENVKQAEVEVIAGRDVFVQINVPNGYVYKSVKHNTFTPEERAKDADNKIQIISDYDPDKDSGEYIILIDKVEVTVQLNTQGTNANSKYFVDGKKSVEGLYVGKTISFSYETSVKERLDYFYYEGPGNAQYKLLEEGTNKPLTTAKITSEMLTNANTTNIVFKVAVVERFRLAIQLDETSVVNEQSTKDFLSEEGVVLINKATNANYMTTGKEAYVDKNTQIALSVATILPGKYNVTLQMINPNPDSKGTNVQKVENVVDIQDLIITLDQDYTYLLTIQPNLYQINIEEYLYDDLTSVLEGRPVKIEDINNQVNGIISRKHYFNQNTEIQLARKTSDRVLSTIYISENDLDVDIVVEFTSTNFVAYKLIDGTTREPIDLSSCGIEIDTTAIAEKVVIRYTTYNNLSVRFDYKEIKVIHP